MPVSPAAAAAALLSASAAGGATVQCDVAVVGAGLSGASAAYRVVAEGAGAARPPKVCIIEATDRVGGRTKDYDIPGCGAPQTVELGAQWIAQREVDPDVWDLAVDVLGLGVHNGWPWQLFFPSYGPGGAPPAALKAALDAVPLASSPAYDAAAMFFGPNVTDADPHVGRCWRQVAAVYRSVVVGEPWRTPGAAALDAATPLQWMQRLGCVVSREDVITQGLDDTSDPARLPPAFWLGSTSAGSSGQEIFWEASALWWLHNVKANHGPMSMVRDLQMYRIVGGPQQMAKRLVERLRARGAHVAMSSPVVEVREHARGVDLVTEQGDVYAARYAVVTGTPVALSAHLRWSPPLPDGAARALAAARIGGYNKHYAFFNGGPVWRDDPAMQAALRRVDVEWPMVYERGPGWPASSQAMPNGTHFLPSAPLDNSPASVPTAGGACAGGAGALFSFGWPANATDAAGRAEGWRRLLAGVPGLPPPSSVHGQVWADEPYVMGAYAAWWRPGAITGAGAGWRGTARVFFAGSEWSASGPGYMQGAVHNGRAVGDRVLCLLGRTPRAPATCA